MGESLESSFDGTGVDTFKVSKTLIATILTAITYDASRALPAYISPSERIVKKKINEFTGLAKITAPYVHTSEKPSFINDVINVQNNFYKCASIPQTYLGADSLSVDRLSAIPDFDIVGIKKYVFNPFDESDCFKFDSVFQEDIHSLKFCNSTMANKFSILTLEAFRDQKRLPIPNETPVPLYIFFVNSRPLVEDSSDQKINESASYGKSIYLLHCNSSNSDGSKYAHRDTKSH